MVGLICYTQFIGRDLAHSEVMAKGCSWCWMICRGCLNRINLNCNCNIGLQNWRRQPSAYCIIFTISINILVNTFNKTTRERIHKVKWDMFRDDCLVFLIIIIFWRGFKIILKQDNSKHTMVIQNQTFSTEWLTDLSEFIILENCCKFFKRAPSPFLHTCVA